MLDDSSLGSQYRFLSGHKCSYSSRKFSIQLQHQLPPGRLQLKC